MLVFLNGKFIPEEQAVVSVFDRSFLYGDGLFEAIPIFNGKPFRWAQHMARFRHGADMLGIPSPYSNDELRKFTIQLAEQNRMTSALMRLSLSRGIGTRGYSPKGAEQPTVVMTLHPLPAFGLENPPGWKLITSSQRLPAGDPLAQFKTCNKLPQILARAQADAVGADEALLLNTDGYVVEGTTSNLFWVSEGVVCTPPLASGVLPGVTRLVVLAICLELKIPVDEIAPRPKELMFAEGVFLSMSSFGIVEAANLDGRPLQTSSLVKKIHRRYREIVEKESR